MSRSTCGMYCGEECSCPHGLSLFEWLNGLANSPALVRAPEWLRVGLRTAQILISLAAVFGFGCACPCACVPCRFRVLYTSPRKVDDLQALIIPHGKILSNPMASNHLNAPLADEAGMINTCPETKFMSVAADDQSRWTQ